MYITSLWEKNTDGDWECKCQFSNHTGTIRSVEWSPDGKRLCSCSFDRRTIVNLIGLIYFK